MDSKTREISGVDLETLSILLRRLHPKISCYNDLVLFLYKYNINIKFVGSGEGAKALVYYITDYITKQVLPTHIGLDMVSAALKSYDKKVEASGSCPAAGTSKGSRALMTKIANSMLATCAGCIVITFSH
jgi:hypothetical protein